MKSPALLPSSPSSVRSLDVRKRLKAACALALVAFAGSASAQTYTYNPIAGAYVWNSGTNWTSTPVSSIDATLIFNPTGGIFPGALVATSDNNLGAFLLNQLSLSGSGATSDLNPVVVNITGDTLDFNMSAGSVLPVINLDATYSLGTSPVNYNLATAIKLTSNTTITGNGNAAFEISGVISDSGGLTKSGTSKVTLSGTNTYTGTTTISAGTVVAQNSQAFGLSPAALTLGGGVLDLATDTSINAYNTTVTGTTTIQSNKATAGSAGITHTLGTLSIGLQTLNITAGANVTGGTPAVAFGAVTLTGNPTFNPTTATLQLGSATGTNRNITLGGTSTGLNTIGAISTGTGTLAKTTASTWLINGTGTYTGNTSFTNGTILVGADNPFGTTSTVIFQGPAVLQSDSSVARAIGNPILLTRGANDVIGTVAGTGNIIFNGLLTNNSTGGDRYFVVNNTGLTTLHGGLRLSPNDNRELSIRGTGDMVIDSGITPAPGGSVTNNLSLYGAQTITLTAPGFIGGDNALAGVNLRIASGGGFATGVQGNIGNTVLRIAGDYTMGASGIMTVAVRGGNGTSISRGTLSLADGSINTLTINSSAADSTVLQLNANGNGTSGIVLEVGSSADKIVLGAGLKATVGNGGVTLNVVGLGNLNGVTQDLLVAPGNTAAFTGANFTLAHSGNYSGYTVALDLSTIGKVKLVETPTFVNPTLATAYWKGDETGSGVAGVWNAFTGGNLNNTNWATTSAGGVDTNYTPGASTDVFFSANGSANLITTLGSNFSIKSLTFTNSGGAASIGGANTLTIGTGGITVDSGAAAPTISAPVTVGSAHTWTNNSANDLTISGAVTTTTGITKSGNGTLILSGVSPNFTGGLLINNGAVRIGSAGAMNSSIPQFVSFPANAPATAKFQTGGTNIAVGGLTTNAVPGSPIIENASATPGTLTVTNGSTFTYAGLIQDGAGGGTLSFAKSGSGTQILSNANTYTGTTTVGGGLLLINGNQSAATGLVNVHSFGSLGGIGTIGGATTVNSGGRITGGDLSSIGNLTLSGSLSITSGGIGYFNISDSAANDTLSVTGGFSIAAGGIIRVSPALTSAMTYNLVSYAGSDPTLGSVVFQDLNGNNLPASYSFSANSGILQLQVTAASYASPSISITTPAGTRVMAGQNFPIGGAIGNPGNLSLNATLADNSSQLTVSNFNPSGSTVVAPNSSQSYTATIATGATLGTRTFGVQVSDPAGQPPLASAESSVNVVANRTVNASSIAFGVIHANSPVTAGSFTLSSSQPDDQYTRVTVANGTNSVVTASGGNPGLVFNGTSSDSRTLSANFSGIGIQSGTLTLTTSGEGLAGETPNNVSVNYTATVFSGKAAWAIPTSGGWSTAANWDDTNASNLGGDGAPGLDGVASLGDTATFGDGPGGSGTVTISLNNVSPSLAGLTFNGVVTSYVIAPGAGGAITLQGAATPVNVTGSHRISAIMTGAGGLFKTGPGTLALAAVSTFTGETAIANGVLQVDVANALPITTNLALGDSSTNTSGKLMLGSSTGTRAQTLSGLTTAGNGFDNRVVGGNAAASTLTVNIAANTVNTYTGFFGGPGTNENNLNLTKAGAGTLVLTQAPGHSGTTTIALGTLQTSTGNDLNGFVDLTATGASLTNYATWQTSGAIVKNIGTSGSGNIRVSAFTGFAAKGGPLTVTLNGNAQLVFGVNFIGNGNNAFMLSSASADNQVEFTNPINLNTGDGFMRTFYVEKSSNANASALLSGVLSPGTGPTGFVKTGGGLLYLNNQNTYTGATAINNGFLVAQNNAPSGAVGAFGSSITSITVGDGGGAGTANTPAGSTGIGLYISGGNYTVGRNLTISAQANVASPNVILGGLTDNTMAFTGNISTSQSFKITQVATTGNNGLTVSGNITATGSRTVTFDNVGRVLFSGVANSANISLTKTNTGTTTLSNTSNYSGPTTVNGGTLLVNGSIAASLTTVNNGGTLGGSGGTVGGVIVNAGGTLAPGASIGTLNAGNVTLNADANFNLEIDTTALTKDLLAATGSLSLALTNDTILNVSDLNPTSLSTGTFVFITYNGTWNNGLFEVGGQVIDDYDATLNPNSASFVIAGNTFQIDYNLGGNSVALNVVPEPNVLVSLLGGAGILVGLRRRRTY